MRSFLLGGAKVRLYINGLAFGRVTNFSWQSETPKKAIYGIDSTEPYELAVTTSRITGSISVLRSSGDGGAEGAGIAAPLHDLSKELYFSIALVEILTDTTIFEATRCSMTGQQWGAPAKGLMSGSISFEAIEWNNEIGK